MKRRILARILSLAMVFTMLPVTPLTAEASTPQGVARSASRAEDANGNLARSAKAEAPYRNPYAGPVDKINDGTLAGGDGGTSWNSWGADEDLYPMPVTLTWDTAQTISSMRVMWWAYHDGGVVFPTSAEVQYLDGEEWKKIADVGLEHGDVDGEGGVWNIVNFSAPVITTSLRMLVNREGEYIGFGISEWEVYNKELKPEITGASIDGTGKLVPGQVETYTGTVLPENLTEASSFEWSVASGADVIEIQGAANQNNVSVKALKGGRAKLHLKATKDEITQETDCTIQVIEEKITSIDVYKTSTAAGVAPILPDSVVANGPEFDDATPETKNGYDFGEVFNARLIPVTWEAVSEESYAADKVGKSFTVKGTADFGGETYAATALITVKKPVVVAASNSSVTFENVQLDDSFWTPRQSTNATTSLDKAILEIEKSTGGEPNFDNAIKKLNGLPYESFKGLVFQDSDIYKSIEAISYTLSATQNDTSAEAVAQRKKLQDKVNTWIEKIEKVQYADGYIDTYFTLRGSADGGGPTPITHRWQDLSRHEMYNAGHLLEGVVAYTRYREGIGDPDYRLYVLGKRFADEIVSLFGPGGTRHEVPGHEEIELALVKLGKLVEEYEGEGAGQSYYDTAKLLINRRGESELEYDEDGDIVDISNNRESGYYGDTYSQDRTPFKEETNAVGHAVRANYFYTGITDIATLLPEGDKDREDYLTSLDAIWTSVTTKKTYITGGIGASTASSDAEGFGADYDLPPGQSYIEICAAIAAANWNQRMNLLHEDGKYADMVEKNLYNSILVGENLDGNRFYYNSLLEVNGGNARSEWFACACCPPNLMRTIASVSGYMYTVHNNDLFVNMYMGSTGKVNVGGTQVGLKQVTKYPWEGAVEMTVSVPESKKFAMKLRIPGWVNEQENKDVTIQVNGQKVNAKIAKGYATIDRTWANNDKVTIDIPMEIRMTESDENVEATQGKIALQRGPIVYCMEKAGNAQLNPGIENFDPLNFVIPRDAKLTADYKENLLRGVVEITGDVKYLQGSKLIDAKLQAIPYYAWNNRGDDAEYIAGLDNPKNNSSKMLIWTMADATVSGKASVREFATPSVRYCYFERTSGKRFADGDKGTFWNGWGDTELQNSDQWMMYDFGSRQADLTECDIHFVDDGRGVITPTGITIEYAKDDGTWASVTPVGDWTYKANDTVSYQFEKVMTSKIRVTMTHAKFGDTKVAVAVAEWDLVGDLVATAEEKKTLTDSIASIEEELKTLNQSEYTSASWAALQQAIDDAKAVLEKEDAGVIEDISEAQIALNAANSNLEKKATEESVTGLRTIVSACDGTEADYTTESWTVFKAVLEQIRAIAHAAEPGQKSIDKAKSDLAKAQAKLEKKAKNTDVNALKAAVASYKEAEYTAESWNKFKDIWKAAKDLSESTAPGEKAVADAMNSLTAIEWKLDKKANSADVTTLRNAVASYKEADYTEASWKKFASTLESAKSVAESSDPGQKRVEAAIASLESGKLTLEKKADTASVTKLGETIAAGSSYKAEEYTAMSWAAYSQALETAKNILNSETATPDMIEAAQKMLEEAEAKLTKKDGDNPPPVDKTALNASITTAKSKKQTDYTITSWNKLKTALTAAQNAADNANATEAQVKTAKDNLDAAVKALVKVKITKKNVTLGVNETYSVKSTGCTYTTSDNKKATVSKSGQVKAVKTGKVTIKATDKDGNITQYTVTVKKAPDKKAKVKLNKKKVTLSVKNKKKKTFIIKPKLTSKSYGCNTFKYTIDKNGKKVVKVDKGGKVTAKKKGKATITVKTYNGKGKAAKLTVTVI